MCGIFEKPSAFLVTHTQISTPLFKFLKNKVNCLLEKLVQSFTALLEVNPLDSYVSLWPEPWRMLDSKHLPTRSDEKMKSMYAA